MKPINLFTVKVLGRPDYEPLDVAARHSGQMMIDLVLKVEAHPEPGPWAVMANGLGRPLKKDPRYKDLPPYLQLDRRSTAEMQRNARNTLWARVGWDERRADAQFARSFSMPMPSFLGLEAQKTLAEAFCQSALVERGMLADWSLSQHAGRHEQDNKQNAIWGRPAIDGAHALKILTTMRSFSRGKFGNKDRSWNDRSLFFVWRKQWCEMLSAAIEAAPAGSCAPSAKTAWQEQCAAYIARDPSLIAEAERLAMEAKKGEGATVQEEATDLSDWPRPPEEVPAPARARRL